MTGTRAAAAICSLGLVAAALAGCGGSGGPAPAPTTITPIPISFHPCDDLPRDVILGLGFSENNWTRVDRESPVVSHECSTARRGPRHGSTFAARGMTFQSVLDDDRLVPVRRGTIDGRDVYYADFADACFATVDVEPGVFQLTVGYSPTSSSPDEFVTTIGEACDEAEKILTVVLPYVPDHL